MRICVITLDFLPFRSSGLSVYAENLVLGLRERGHQVSVIAAQRTSRKLPVESGVSQLADQVHRLRVGKLDWFALGLAASKWLMRNDHAFDVVHFTDLHFAFAYPRPCVASAFHSFRQRMKSNRGLPYFVDFFDLSFKLAYYSFARLVAEPLALRHSKFILMSSYTTMREFTENYHADPSRAAVVYPGISLEPLLDLPTKKDARRILGLPLDRKILLFVGFGAPRKGLEYLLDSFELLHSDVVLLLVGHWNQRFLRRFKEKATRKGLMDRIVIAGYVPDSQKRLYYASADIFVFPSLLEGFGIPLVEAMASGLPVVTTYGGAAAEIVGSAGICVQPGDHLGLYEAIRSLLEDSNLRTTLSSAGVERATTLFDIRKMAQSVEEAYKRLGSR